jgi:alpha-N-arabinofuranosidase
MKSIFTLCCLAATLQLTAQNTLVINADLGNTTISKHIYGHFAEHLGHGIYGGIWVGENSTIPNTRGIRNDVVKALKEIQIPNLRWPGGCFADEYHWMDGIGPKDLRPKMINTHWGGVTEDNAFGTHEFLDLCEQLQCEPYICGNVGSGTVEEMSKWVEYINSDNDSPMTQLRKQNGRTDPWKVKFWGVGNENWGCGGNMTAQFYADLYKRYATYCRNYGDNKLFKIAGGANGDDYQWTEILMGNAAKLMQGISLHYYTVPIDWNHKGSATQFDEQLYFETVRKTLVMEQLLTKHSHIMDQYDPDKRVALVPDEWGTWYDAEPNTNPGFLFQQNTLRDAIVAGINLNIFNNHADRVKMANIAQMVNVLQAVIITDNEKIILTPTYWTFFLYKVHQDAMLLPVHLQSDKYTIDDQSVDAISVSASKNKDGKIHITLVNVDPKQQQSIQTTIRGANIKNVTGQILTAGKLNDHNTTDGPNNVKVTDFKDAKLSKGDLHITLPPKSVVLLQLD